jgi:hypothetical protein
MMAIGSAQEDQKQSAPPPVFSDQTPPPSSTSSTTSEVHFTERKVFAALDGEPDPDPKRWIMDTGASNHMSGSRVAFAHLDTTVHGSMRFGDGSIAQIKGSGTVLFTCKNGEHHSLPNVYYLSRLTANIVSIGQLDEGGYQVLIEDGVMRVRDDPKEPARQNPKEPRQAVRARGQHCAPSLPGGAHH